MAERAPKIRLYVDAPLRQGLEVETQTQAHYLVNVMRQSAGDRVELFNGEDGAWAAEILRAGKRAVSMRCVAKTSEQSMPPDLELLFAPIKKARTDFIVEKATELGVRSIRPVFTRFTNAERVRPEKLRAHCIEAAEQCGGTFVPDLRDAAPLDAVLSDWPEGRKLLFCDERMDAPDAAAALRNAGPGAWSILIGPEGGFSDEESARLRALPFATTVMLGPRVLRADTAAVAALTLWQSALGDW
ncbi:16S rRNA (uracil(1498)-N(3))-methyltransferase [Pontivivens insulae]|uniref:Ribosomal RNA small subunit methyltransferase E n=1 Tax=Pontivivens insulae TaxID=1639689 RepID=A0A2R8A6K9_9RHOB|nr:16S rRNA (uracil(1498)-N(3))-methyltransferase [Pontivivens insulae]RED17902.1 16S rRNA (uracil1498-N3)-methyltransferase [Pontivivens insulae]SPF27792.1 Ribosomal RNA small subunit methyltransferase E [Pontivivens insulae]